MADSTVDPLAEFISSINKSGLSTDTSGFTAAQKAIFNSGIRRNNTRAAATGEQPATVWAGVTAKAADKTINEAFAKNPFDTSLDALDPTLGVARNIQQQLVEQAQDYRVNWKNKAKNATYHTANLALKLADKGVTDINKLRVGESSGQLIDTVSGAEINFRKKKGKSSAFASAAGNGWTNYRFASSDKGSPIFYQQWEESSDKGKIAPILGLGLSLFAPGLGTAIGSALGASGAAASALGSGLVSSGLAAAAGARGKDILKSGLAGAAGSFLPKYLSPTVGKIPASAITGVVRSGITGSDPVLGAIMGGFNATGVGQRLGFTGTQANAVNSILGNILKQKITPIRRKG